MDSLYQVIAVSVSAVSVIVALLLKLASKPAPAPAAPAAGCCGSAAAAAPVAAKPPTLGDRFTAILTAIDYLRTRREWRYRTPWVLLLGEVGAGKSSALNSASGKGWQTDAWRQQELAVNGTDWQFFRQGILIDPAGRLPAAAAGSVDADIWSGILSDIDALRPERPLDGLVLAVSAHSLLSKSAEERRQLAKNAYSQLDRIQQRFEFTLPVYVVVTQADNIDGFSAFWRTQAAQRKTEIFGWSAPPDAGSGTPEDWTDSAFDVIGERLKSLQVEAAAVPEQIEDADRFFLFPRHFQRLRQPLKDWLGAAFQQSAWSAGFLCRGIYFTGSMAADGEQNGQVRGDIAFVDDLIAQKLLAEPHLARPTRHGIWSRNQLIRGLQIGGVLLFCGMLAALAIAAAHLHDQVDALVSSLNTMQRIHASHKSGDACIDKESVYDLLEQISRIDINLHYAAIPASLDPRPSNKSAALIADALKSIVMPGLKCRLEQRAQELFVFTPQAPDADKDNGDTYTPARLALFDYLKSVEQLEANLARFRKLSSYAPASQSQRQIQALADLAQYVYGSPVPAAVLEEHGALGAALARMIYRAPLEVQDGKQIRYPTQIRNLAQELRTSLDQETHAGDTLLKQLNSALLNDQTPILDDARHFNWWLTWTRRSWLGSTAQINPCEEIRAALQIRINELVNRYEFDPALKDIGDQFSAESCYQKSMDTLIAIQLAPYGTLFTQQNKVLLLNPRLVPEANGLNALLGLAYMQITPLHPFACQAAASGWQAAEIGQAAGYAKDYQTFAKAHGLPAAGADLQPLYDRLAQHQLELAMNSALGAAQTPAIDGAATPPNNLDAAALADQQLSAQSSAFSGVQAPLQDLLKIYGQLGFKRGPAIAQCIGNFSSARLGQISTLANVSNVYNPDPGPVGGDFFNLGTTAITNDYLARQLTRSQVLAGYAAPFVNFLGSQASINQSQDANEQTTPYWNNTITEINRQVQFKDSSGQVGMLNDLFVKQLAGLNADNCKQALSASAGEYGNDLFSVQRKRLEEDAHLRCDNSRNAQALVAYRDLAKRFTAELAEHYPFGDTDKPDASLATTQSFFNDYALQRAALHKSLAGLSGERWTAARNFLDQLDAVSTFFSGTLTGVDARSPLKLTVTFRADPDDSPGSEQIFNWILTSGAKSTGYPNRPNTLDWPYGQALLLDLSWANRSLWTPVKDPAQRDMQVDGASVSFATSGNWALLRMIANHAPQSGRAVDPQNPNRALLQFNVPVVSAGVSPGKPARDSARLYLGLNLSGKDPKTQAPVTLTVPAFPHFAPQ